MSNSLFDFLEDIFEDSTSFGTSFTENRLITAADVAYQGSKTTCAVQWTSQFSVTNESADTAYKSGNEVTVVTGDRTVHNSDFYVSKATTVQTNDKTTVVTYDDDVAESPYCSSHNIPRNATVFNSKDAGDYSNVESTVFNSKQSTHNGSNKTSHHVSKKVN